MFVHIGNGKNIKSRGIIGIFDLDSSTVSKITKKYINQRQRQGRVRYEDSDLPRSFVLTADDDGGDKIYLSRISAKVLCERCENKNSYE